MTDRNDNSHQSPQQETATGRTTRIGSIVRIAIASMLLLPAITFSTVCFIAKPDAESWFKHLTKGYFRPDAFEHLNLGLPFFTIVLAVTSTLAFILVLTRRSQLLLPLAAGPLLMTLIYLAEHGTSDPAWQTLLALMSVGMFAGTPITALWALSSRSPVNSRILPTLPPSTTPIDHSKSS